MGGGGWGEVVKSEWLSRSRMCDYVSKEKDQYREREDAVVSRKTGG